MKPPLDPFELLRRMNPVRPGELPDADSPEAQALLEQIVERSTRPRKSLLRLPHRRRTYAVVLVAAVALGAAAAWAVTRGETKHLTIGCYAETSLDAKTAVIPAGTASLEAACAAVWRSGTFGSKAVPRLQACILPSGAIGVFPTRDGRACERLHLANAQPRTPERAQPTTGLKNALVDRFLAASCLTEDEGLGIVEDELRKRHLSTWRVRAAAPFTPARPCATLAFDEEQQTVLLTPAPRP